jgi:hypothetical protein
LGGSNNLNADYEMQSVDSDQWMRLLVTEEEKDLGIWMDNKIKASCHVLKAVKKANQLLGLIRRSFTHMDGALMRILFTSVVRPHLEYGNVVWHPFLQKDIDLIESVQHRATRMVPGFAKLEYAERLQRMNLPTLAYRRNRGDAIELFKYLHGIYKVDCTQLLPLRDTDNRRMRTRGHSLMLQKRDCHSQLRQNFFSIRMVNLWNSLPEAVVTSSTVNCFKGRFDRACEENKYQMEWKTIKACDDTRMRDRKDLG